MSSAKQRASILRVLQILEEWDTGSKKIRQKILKDFVAQNKNKTGPEIEQEFAQAASLFLARLVAYLQLTHKFMAEFLELGGVLTLLNILSIRERPDRDPIRDMDKAAALVCLQHIANAGRKCKELICQSYGVRAVAKCLVQARTIVVQDACCDLLLALSKGNPSYQTFVYKSLIALLASPTPQAQQVAAHIIRMMQPLVCHVNPSIVEPVLNLLKSSFVEVQYEATELIKLLMDYDVAQTLLRGLVTSLRPCLDVKSKPELGTTCDKRDETNTEENKLRDQMYRQQAAAARIIRSLAAQSHQLAERLIQMRVIHHLLVSMGNTKHPDSQRQASITLEYFCQKHSIVDDHVHEAMGKVLYDAFKANPEAMYVNMDNVQADVLVSNKVNVPKNMEEAVS